MHSKFIIFQSKVLDALHILFLAKQNQFQKHDGKELVLYIYFDDSI